MTEKDKDEVETEKGKDEVETEKGKDETPLPKLVETIRAEYETRITEMEAKHAAAIADRDAIIQQLISGNPSGTVSNETLIDKINEKRKFKKW